MAACDFLERIVYPVGVQGRCGHSKTFAGVSSNAFNKYVSYCRSVPSNHLLLNLLIYLFLFFSPLSICVRILTVSHSWVTGSTTGDLLLSDIVLKYRISPNNSRPSINRLPQIIAPSPTFSPSSLPFIPSLSGWSAMRFSKTDQRRFKLWKLIKELNSEHSKSSCSVYLTWLLFDLMGKQNKIFRARLPVSNVWNNRLTRIIAFSQIIAPFLCEKKKKKHSPRLLFEEIRCSSCYCWLQPLFLNGSKME